MCPCFVRILIDNTNNRLQELKGHLLKRKQPEKIIDYSFTKLFQPRKHENNDKNFIPSLELKILIIDFLSPNLKIALKTPQTENFEKHLMIKKYSLLHDNQRNICSEHLRDCNQAVPYFQIFPFYYETNIALN